MADIRPIFLLSLPRSGSTLVQRVLAAHRDVATASEPWLLLPFLYARGGDGLLAEYDQQLYRQALDDFIAVLPEGRADYDRALRDFTLRLYRQAAGPEPAYFLDKTPRYALVAEQLADVFPDARFVFLWRNPLAVVASISETWDDGRWNVYLFKVDLFKGLEGLVDAYQRLGDRAVAVQYEALVQQPEQAWRPVFDYLDLPFDPALLERFTGVRLEGGMGDPTQGRYGGISDASLAKWREGLATPLRKAWARRYLRWIGAERLALMGYDLDALLRDLAAAPTTTRGLASDALRMAQGLLHPWLEPTLARTKRRGLAHPHRVVVHK